MLNRSVIIYLIATLVALNALWAEPRSVAISYFDVGKLYDTVASPFYFDEAYTPKGRLRWTSERYHEEVGRVTAVIDSMALPIVALYGVESEEVVRDIVMASSEDYCYIHRELDYFDGLDFALLYYGDHFFVESVDGNNTWMYVSGEIFDRRVDINLVRLSSRIRSIVPSQTADGITLVMGRLTSDDIERLGAEDVLRDLERKGGGDTRDERGWRFNSRIGVRSGVEVSRAGVYITDWLVRPQLYEPYLPSFVVFEVE